MHAATTAVGVGNFYPIPVKCDFRNYLVGANLRQDVGMKLRICFLVMSLAALIWYAVVQLAPSGRAATVSTQFHQLGKTAMLRLENAQDAGSEPEFETRIANADMAVDMARRATVSAADQREFAQLMSYMMAVKQDHTLALTSSDPSQPPDHDAVNNARAAAEAIFK